VTYCYSQTLVRDNKIIAVAFGFKGASDIKMNKKQIVSFNGELTIKTAFAQ